MEKSRAYKRLLEKLSSFSDEELSLLSQIIVEKLQESRYPPITKLELFITQDCNLRCDYFFVRNKSPRYMSWEVVKESIAFLFTESRNVKDITIIFFGGEPLLLWGIIQKAVIYAEKLANRLGKNVHYSLTTNGVLLSEKILRFSQRHKIMHLLSIDGDKETHDKHRHFPDGRGTFDEVISKIPLLKKYQGWLGTRMTITPETVHRLSDNVKFLFCLGINQFIIGADHDIIWDKTSIKEYKKQLLMVAKFYKEKISAGEPIRMTAFEEDCQQIEAKFSNRWGCEAGADKICVSPDGSLYPCSRFISTDEEGSSYYKLGDVWRGITNHRLRDDLLDQREMIRFKCMKCNYKDFCAGGCPALNLLKTGSLYHPWHTQCLFTKILIDTLAEVPELFQNREEKVR